MEQEDLGAASALVSFAANADYVLGHLRVLSRDFLQRVLTFALFEPVTKCPIIAEIDRYLTTTARLLLIEERVRIERVCLESIRKRSMQWRNSRTLPGRR